MRTFFVITIVFFCLLSCKQEYFSATFKEVQDSSLIAGKWIIIESPYTYLDNGDYIYFLSSGTCYGFLSKSNYFTLPSPWAFSSDSLITERLQSSYSNYSTKKYKISTLNDNEMILTGRLNSNVFSIILYRSN